jgi:hypothetical protein
MVRDNAARARFVAGLATLTADLGLDGVDYNWSVSLLSATTSRPLIL